MRSRWVSLPLLFVLACKDKPAHEAPATPPAPPKPAGSATTGSAAPRPELPEDVVDKANPPEPMLIEEARAALPKIVGAVILDLKQTSDKRQVHATWCIDGSGADDVAKLVGKWMAEAGYTALSIRGDARKAGVSGDRGTIRLSMVVAASGAANCAAPQHYFASATIFRP
ncbi:MAG TPA: hypothetical protein VL326_33995 [Kofleriaceae bacterium]|nr:hypothetical protein [Kofleriaceae bacterium]